MPGYQLLADAVLVLHAAIVLFVVAGLPLILIGNRYGWPWVNAPWFRLAHVATIGIVVAEAWIGMVCPLTTLEMWLRVRAQTQAGPYYANGFIEHWLQALLFWNALWGGDCFGAVVSGARGAGGRAGSGVGLDCDGEREMDVSRE